MIIIRMSVCPFSTCCFWHLKTKVHFQDDKTYSSFEFLNKDSNDKYFVVVVKYLSLLRYLKLTDYSTIKKCYPNCC